MASSIDEHETKNIHLGKLSVSILENLVKPVIGEAAINIIKEPVLYQKQEKKLIKSLSETEIRFINEFHDQNICRALIDLPLADLDSVQMALRNFFRHPANPSFKQTLELILQKDYPNLPKGRIIGSIETYLNILREELASEFPEFATKMTALAAMSTQYYIKEIHDLLKSDWAPKNSTSYWPTILMIYSSVHMNEARLIKWVVESLEGQAYFIIHDISGLVDQDQSLQVRKQIQNSDYIIPLLSQESLYSEMMLFELEIASKVSRTPNNNKPRIIPVRINNQLNFQYPLTEYLSNLTTLSWQSPEDDPNIYIGISSTIKGKPDSLLSLAENNSSSMDIDFSRPFPAADARIKDIPFERADGTMRADSFFYIEREGDHRIRKLISNWSYDGITITINAPRQVGKSSMLMKGINFASNQGKRAVVLDFQEIDQSDLTNPTTFFRSFCGWLIDQLDLGLDLNLIWRSNLGNSQQCTSFIKRYVLTNLDQPIILAMDEVDRILNSPVRSDFFRMLRAWHNKRAEGGDWFKLGLFMVISTEPYMLIPYGSESPFNVGDIITLDDFSFEQVQDLNFRYQNPFSESQLIHLMNLLSGHPFLTRQAMYRVFIRDFTPEILLTHASDDTGPFGDHLKRYLFHLHESPELSEAMRQIIHRKITPPDKLVFQLKSAGLVLSKDQQIIPRNYLYANYFIRHL